MPTDPVPFVQNGMQPLLAIEVARQIDDRFNTKPQYFMGLNMSAPLAAELSRQISTGLTSVRNLGGVGMPGGLAVAVVAAIIEVTQQIVGTGGVVPFSLFTTGARTRTISRIPLLIGGDCSYLQLCFDNWYIDADGAAADADQTVTIVGLAIEQDSPSLTVPVTFEGEYSATLSRGELQRKSDPLPASAFGLTKFSRDALYWVRITATIPSSGSFLEGPSTGSAGAATYYCTPANNIDQVYSTGVLTAPTGATQRNFGYGPSAVLGAYLEPGMLSAIGIGDSIMMNNNDPTPVASGPAFFSRAAMDNGVASGVIAQTKIARGGTLASQFAANTRAQTYFAFGNVLVDEFGANDTTSGATAATTFGHCQTTWDAARDYGIERIVRTLLIGRTDSTDDYETEANQAYHGVAWTPGGPVSQLNDLFEGALADGEIDALVTNDGSRDPTFPYKWITNGTPDYPTVDGLHPTAALHTINGAETRTVLQGLTVS